MTTTWCARKVKAPWRAEGARRGPSGLADLPAFRDAANADATTIGGCAVPALCGKVSRRYVGNSVSKLRETAMLKGFRNFLMRGDVIV
ncbi:MAG: hypothetical protein ACREDL_06080, partial [Bradyrhizobium sp.]